jgi:hypothetical protein
MKFILAWRWNSKKAEKCTSMLIHSLINTVVCRVERDRLVSPLSFNQQPKQSSRGQSSGHFLRYISIKIFSTHSLSSSQQPQQSVIFKCTTSLSYSASPVVQKLRFKVVYRNSVDCIASHYKPVGHGIESRWGGAFSALILTGPRATEPPQKWVAGLLPRAKRSGRGVDHPPQFSAQVQERVELHFHSPSRPSQTLLRRNSFYLTVVTHGTKKISN